VKATCANFEDVAPELALGLLGGGQRADALSHLVSCPTCRALAEDLAGVADTLLLLAPEAEPSVGFETRVLDHIAPSVPAPEPRRSRWRRSLVPAVAAGAAAAGLLAGVVLTRPAPRSRLDRDYVAALRTLGGSALRAARLHAPDGSDAGEVFLYQGHPSWAFVEVHDPAAAAGSYTVELHSPNAMTVTVGGMALRDGTGSVGASVVADMEDVTGVDVLGPDGTLRYRAQLPAAS